jgi:hypothetical protein
MAAATKDFEPEATEETEKDVRRKDGRKMEAGR